MRSGAHTGAGNRLASSQSRPRHGTGALRDDFGSADVPLLLEHLTVRITASDERSTALRVRYLELMLVGLRGSTASRGLYGWAELRALWNAP